MAMRRARKSKLSTKAAKRLIAELWGAEPFCMPRHPKRFLKSLQRSTHQHHHELP